MSNQAMRFIGECFLYDPPMRNSTVPSISGMRPHVRNNLAITSASAGSQQQNARSTCDLQNRSQRGSRLLIDCTSLDEVFSDTVACRTSGTRKRNGFNRSSSDSSQKSIVVSEPVTRTCRSMNQITVKRYRGSCYLLHTSENNKGITDKNTRRLNTRKQRRKQTRKQKHNNALRIRDSRESNVSRPTRQFSRRRLALEADVKTSPLCEKTFQPGSGEGPSRQRAFSLVTTMMVLNTLKVLTKRMQFVPIDEICLYMVAHYPVNRAIEDLLMEVIVKLEELTQQGLVEKNKEGTGWALSEDAEQGLGEVGASGHDVFMTKIHDQHDRPINPQRPFEPRTDPFIIHEDTDHNTIQDII